MQFACPFFSAWGAVCCIFWHVLLHVQSLLQDQCGAGCHFSAVGIFAASSCVLSPPTRGEFLPNYTMAQSCHPVLHRTPPPANVILTTHLMLAHEHTMDKQIQTTRSTGPQFQWNSPSAEGIPITDHQTV